MNFCIEYSQCAPGLKESTKHYNLGNLRKELKVGKVEMKILILIHASNQNPSIFFLRVSHLLFMSQYTFKLLATSAP